MLKMRLKKAGVDILRFVLGILPIATYLIVFSDRYFNTGKGWSCFVYIGLLILIMTLKDTFSDLLKRNAQLKICLAIVVFAYFFKYVSSEMLWFSIMGAIGGALAIIPDVISREIAKDIDAKRQGMAVAIAFKESEIKVVKK